MKTARPVLMLALVCLVGCTAPMAAPSPTPEPTSLPTARPTVQATTAPSATPEPTSEPTSTPTTEPSPTAVPTDTPTTQPSPVPQEPIFPEMVRVEPGTFLMGSEEGLRYEKPVHEVTLTRAYYIAIYPVTFDEYDRFCAATGRTPVSDNGWGRGQRPITNINWYDAIDYCNWLSLRDGLDPVYSGQGKNTMWDMEANGYRLLTEAEWEYAARGGNLAQDTLYAGSNDPDEVGWYAANAENMTHPVGLKTLNELGIYDLSGNIWELCWDWYDKDYYQNSPAVDPTGPDSGSDRSRRGGHYLENEGTLRITYRSADMPTYSANGFRIARSE